MVDLSGVHRVTTRKGGKAYTYVYAWRGGPRLRAKEGTAAFVAELAEAQASRKGGDPDRVVGLCIAWKTSDQWTKAPEHGGLAESTKKNWRRWLDEIQTHFGPLRIKHFERAEIRQDIKKWRNRWKSTPRAADMAKQVLSALLTFAVDEGKLSSNPCIGIKNLYANDRSEIIWEATDLDHFAKTASPEVMWALRLATLTGLRQADLLRLSWSHVGELAIEMRTGKSGEKRTALVPLYGELDELLAEIPKRATTVLTNTEGRPWKSGFSSSWNKACWAALSPEARAKAEAENLTLEEAGWKLHFHDARGTACTNFYLARDAQGAPVFTIKEIAELMAWSEDKVERIISRYVRRNALLRDRIRRMDEARQNARGTEAVKPAVKPAG